MICNWHLCENEVVGRKGKLYCSLRCKNKAMVLRARRRLKARAVEHKGGKCEYCGYDRCIWVLEFHHLDPDKKDMSISRDGNTQGWEKIKRELEKCILVCANCHREIHCGLLKVSAGTVNPE